MPVFASKYPGKCQKCGNSYAIGDRIFWQPKEKAVHYKCSVNRPKITLEEDGDSLHLSFPYDEELLNIVRSIPGRQFDPSFKIWTVPNTQRSRQILESNAEIMDFEAVGAIELKKTLTVSLEDTHADYPFLFKHQAQVVNTAVNENKTKLYLGLPAGTGKSLASASSMDALNAYPLLIVGLAGIKVNWQREIKKFYGKESQILESRTPYPITENIVIINYDILDAWADTLKKHKFKGIIFDESAYIKSVDAKRTKAAVKISKGVKNIMMLSGTPTPSSPYDLVPPLTILGEISKYGGRDNYVSRYCPPVDTAYGVSHSNYQNLPELHENLKKTCFISWKKEDLIDLPSLTVYDEMVEGRSSTMSELIKSMEAPTTKEAYRVLREHKEGSEGVFAKMRSESGRGKIRAITEETMAVAESEKVIVGVHHREVNDEVTKSLSKKFKTVQIIGGMGTDKRQASIDAFQDGDAQVLVMNIVAGGVGINLQNASHMILGELPISYADQDQVISRIYRSGQKNKVSVKRMVALGTIDDVLISLISKKKGLHTAVMSGESSDGVNIMEEMASYLVQRKELLG